GSHTFSLATNFKQAGIYTVKATDLSNSQVYGEQVFTVGEGGSSSSNSSKKISIMTPVSGVVGNNVQVVSGMASPGARIKIFDNEISIATTNADASGNFSYTTGMLADGSHKIYVATVNDIDTIIDTSNIVDLTIDVSAPEISQVVFDPSSPVDPGTTVNVKAYIEEDLLKAQVIFTGNVYDMTKAQGYYETAVVMPIDFGEYDLEFKMTDQLGNETSVKGEHKITVGVFGGKETPKNVTNLTATPMDRKVILNWSAPENLLVDHYRVHYGMSPNKMTEAVDTFTDSTTWYISNLQNGVNYYFAVVAVDVQGNTSQNFDKIVTAVPNPVVSGGTSPDVLYGYGGADAIKDMKKDASESGPEVLWLIIPALLGGFCYSVASKKKKEFI
ncbi:MAG: fibronectin type III domain-containing protein, partial [Patescibacteria group bacterium]